MWHYLNFIGGVLTFISKVSIKDQETKENPSAGLMENLWLNK